VSYRVLILRRAQKELGALPGAMFEKVVTSIRDLGEDPRPQGCSKLTGRDEIDDAGQCVTVLHVGHLKIVRMFIADADRRRRRVDRDLRERKAPKRVRT
jgi:mRNA interferase RelE/StbE